jgi:hypothetical protein
MLRLLSTLLLTWAYFSPQRALSYSDTRSFSTTGSMFEGSQAYGTFRVSNAFVILFSLHQPLPICCT